MSSSPFFDAIRAIENLQCDLDVTLEIAKYRMDPEVYDTLATISSRASKALKTLTPEHASSRVGGNTDE